MPTLGIPVLGFTPALGYSILAADTHAELAEHDTIRGELVFRVNAASASIATGSANFGFFLNVGLSVQESTPIYEQVYSTCTAQAGAPCSPSGPLSLGEHRLTFEGIPECWTEGQQQEPPPCYTANFYTDVQVMLMSLETARKVGTIELDITITSLTFTRIPASQ
jgi:hypothetical protein